MHDDLISITEERIRLAPERFILPLIQRDYCSLEVEAVSVGGEPIPYGVAVGLDYKPMVVGDEWGARWDTTWFKFSGDVPMHWQGEKVVADVHLSMVGLQGVGYEGMVWMDGKPVVSVSGNGEVITLIDSALGGERIEFYIEAVAGPTGGLGVSGDDLLMPDYDGDLQYRLGLARMGTYDDEAYQLLIDFRSVSEAMFLLPAGMPRRGHLLRALNESCQDLEYANQYCIQSARGALNEVLYKRNGDTSHCVTAVGSGSVADAWSYPLRESIRRCARHFTTVLREMERYPDYRYACSETVYYLWMRKYYPSIFSAIKAAVKRGQWEHVGGMWVEADCHLVSGDSIVRQLLHGKHFLMDELGLDGRVMTMSDACGYVAGLPQLLEKSGVDWLLMKYSSGSDVLAFPHSSFNWQGLDGSEVFTHIPPVDGSGYLGAEGILYSQDHFGDADRLSHSLMTFSEDDECSRVDQIELARRYSDFEGLPQVSLGSVVDFFENASADIQYPSVWRGELELGLRRGGLTSQAFNKKMNRRCEFLLRDAEMLQVVMASLGEDELLVKMPALGKIPLWDVQGHIKSKQDSLTSRALDRAWKLLLLNQSKHILSGGSIHWVYEDSRCDYANIEEIALAVRDRAMELLSGMVTTEGYTDPVLVFNSLSHVRDEVVELPGGELGFVTVPQCGYTVIASDSGAGLPEGLTPVTIEYTDDGYSVYNGLVTLEVNHSGLVTSLYDVENSREVIAEDSMGNLFQVHNDYPNGGGAGDVDFFYEASVEHLLDHAMVSVVEQGDLRVVLHVSRAFGQSQIEQDIVINAGSRRVDFRTEVDWQERNRLLKVVFPVEVRSHRASYETQYGHVERSTHVNRSEDRMGFDLPAYKWVDLSESGYGVAMLNDSKYGHSVKGRDMYMTLLKSGGAPDPEADRGVHQFTYSLLPHYGTLQEGGVIEQAYSLNVPLVMQKTGEHVGDLPSEQSFFAVGRAGVIIDSVKRAERGSDVVVRLYEAYQSRGDLSLVSSLHCDSEVHEVDLMENEMYALGSDGGEVVLNIKPFEVRNIQFGK